MTQALKEAPANVVMPFDFLRLIWIAAGAYIANRERLRGKSREKDNQA
jgi:hypothetical protein